VSGCRNQNQLFIWAKREHIVLSLLEYCLNHMPKIITLKPPKSWSVRENQIEDW